MHNFMQLGVRDAEFPAPNRRRAFDGGVFEPIAKSVSTNHSSRAHDYQALLTRAGNIHCTPPVHCKGALETQVAARCHDNARSSSQSTYSRRPANNHSPSIFTNVS